MPNLHESIGKLLGFRTKFVTAVAFITSIHKNQLNTYIPVIHHTTRCDKMTFKGHLQQYKNKPKERYTRPLQ